MRFRLTYTGKLKGNSRKASDKCALREYFHPQLKNFWKSHKQLNAWMTNGDYFLPKDEWYKEMIPLRDCYANQYSVDGVHFVPLAIKPLYLECRISILLLVAPNSSHLVARGDIDNRAKTLLDGLRMPQQASEITNEIRTHDLSNPLYVLMDDDNRVAKLSVEYDTYLAATDLDIENDIVSAVIDVDVRPSLVGFDTTAFL